MREIIIKLLCAVCIALMIFGCTDKTGDNPTRYFPSDTGARVTNPFSSWSLFFSSSFNPGFLPVNVYTPPGYDFTGNGRPYPVLYLLAPFRGDELYYFDHGLSEVANRLIDEGKIEPMIIVCISGESDLGGSFYTDSKRNGAYMRAIITDTMYQEFAEAGTFLNSPGAGVKDLLADALITRIDGTYSTLPDKANRAIAGVGMGGYGAFRATLESDLFGSVSAVNAPLDFDGLGGGGFITLINQLAPGGDIDNIDTALGDPSMSLVVTAASAFTPNTVDFDVDYLFLNAFGVVSLAIDSSTIETAIPTPFATDISLQTSHNVHLPVMPTGGLNSTVFGVWRDNHDIASLYAAADASRQSDFDNLPKFLVKSEGAEFYYNQQMDGFMEFLQNSGSITNYSMMGFRGNDLLQGTSALFINDLLEDLLIFHSDNFDVPDILD